MSKVFISYRHVSSDQDLADAPPLPGDPAALLQAWQLKLALTFDAEEKIVPTWPVEEPRRQEEPQFR